MLRRLSFICICLIFVSIVVTSFHHHDDGDDHPECSICVAIHQQSDSPYSFVRHEIVRPILETVFVCSVPALFPTTLVISPNDRAPPA